MPRDKKLSHQRVLEAAKKEFIEKLSDGFDTVIGENDKNFSVQEKIYFI